MKNIKGLIVLSLALMTIFGACKKEEKKPDPDPAPVVPAPTVPATFTRKILVEEFTGAWCGYCPDGALILENMIDANPIKVIGVSIHQGDGMDKLSPTVWSSNLNDTYYINTFFVPGFPAGMVNRVPYIGLVGINRNEWVAATAIELAKTTAVCGLKIDSKYNATQDSVLITVHAGFNQTVSGTINLTVFLVEDSVTGTGSSYDQVNYYSYQYGSKAAGGSSHPYYNLLGTVSGWNHMQVLRKIATANTGDAIPTASIVAGGEYIYTKTIAVKSTYDKTNLKMVAFIHSVGSTETTHEVLNVQEAKIGTLKNWD